MERHRFTAADWVLVGMFVAMVLAVVVIAYVATRQPVLVPVFEVIVVPDAVRPRLA